MKKIFVDQMNRKVEIPFPPQRIVSLVPSQTELLFDLGLEERVVGITKFCVHPEEWHKSKTIVGGTKNLWLDKIDSLRPDLIIGNKEENTRDDIAALEKKYPVWMSDVNDIESAIQMITSLADVSASETRGKKIITSIKKSLSMFPRFLPLTALYLIWYDPWMAVGKNTFVDSMINAIGFVNGIGGKRYPELTDQQIIKLDPQIVFLPSEPFPFKAMHVEKLKALLQHARVVIVDGEMFSWFGSRMKLAGEYFKSITI